MKKNVRVMFAPKRGPIEIADYDKANWLPLNGTQSSPGAIQLGLRKLYDDYIRLHGGSALAVFGGGGGAKRKRWQTAADPCRVGALCSACTGIAARNRRRHAPPPTADLDSD